MLKRSWDKKKYPSATPTAEGYFSALGATPHSGRVSQAWLEANTMFVTSALPHDVAFLADVPLISRMLLRLLVAEKHCFSC